MERRLLKHVQNFWFLLITFGTGLFYFCFYLVSLIFGLSLSFTLIGIPLLKNIMRTTQTFTQYERIQTKLYTDISIEPYPGKTLAEGSVWLQAKEELLDPVNWKAIQWLMLKFLLGLVCLVGAFVLYLSPLIMILAPLMLHYVDMYIVVPIDTLFKSLIVMAIGFICVFAGGKLGSLLVRLAGGYTRGMFQALNRTDRRKNWDVFSR
ncbi:sensor domain-containing protein [Paenibacillus sp. FJAT-26967]|uniref:sensor domain-containing protein n=1 Tax=Paenibacillus sp. FJAT-26967 TaxID=1729690 RepID=UPI000837CA97|nr:sensor domain-containing protein [Paenibacillus sp. FJAT-26967]